MQWVWNRRGQNAEMQTGQRTTLNAQPNSSSSHRSVAIWGEGFCDDDFFESSTVRDLHSCAPAEYIRAFAGVLRNGSSSSRLLEDHLTQCAAVRAWRLRGAPRLPRLKSTKPSDVSSVGSDKHPAWFAGPDLPTENQLDGEVFLLTFADEILWRLQNQVVGHYHESTASLFAFATGVHPIYLWNEALVSHELHTAVGWLGVLNRGNRAYMPADIADYFLDVIVTDGSGSFRIRDSRITHFLKDESTIDHIRRVALRRRKGASVATGRLSPFRAPQVDVSSWPNADFWLKSLSDDFAGGG